MKRMSRNLKVKALLMIVMLIFTIATRVTAIASSNSGSIECKGYASSEELESLRLMFAENSGNLLAGTK